MAMRLPGHRTACMCPACRASRGETWKTKMRFTASVNTILLGDLKDWAQEHNTSLTGAIEEAIKSLLQKDDQEKKRHKIIEILQRPSSPGIREYTKEEVQSYIEGDKIEPGLAERAEAGIRAALEQSA